MRAALFNKSRLNFDGHLSFSPIEKAVTKLTCYETTEPSQVVKHMGNCEILISKELQLNARTIEHLPNKVDLICEAGTGFDNIDLKAAETRKIKVCNVPDYSTSHVAQLTIRFILEMSSALPRISEVKGKILGVIGAGTIGQQIISLARALEMDVRVYSRTVRTWNDAGVIQMDSLEEVLSVSHFITLHCPLNNGTRNLIHKETIRSMKKGAYLINTARGGLVDHEDLADALQSGQIAGAALDVQDPEPLPIDNVLRLMENVILTNHIGWKAIEARDRLIKAVAENIKKYIKTGEALNQVHAN